MHDCKGKSRQFFALNFSIKEIKRTRVNKKTGCFRMDNEKRIHFNG